MPSSSRPRPAVLCILDGWGHRPDPRYNAILDARTPNYDRLIATCPQGLIDASETFVGLPKGQMGNSEVGHMNLGAGRVAVPDLPMSAFFSASMLSGMIWLGSGRTRWLTAAAASLGFAMLAKGLVPLVLAIPFAWSARAKWKDLLRWQPVAAFLAVAAPWYVLCYLKNGAPFIRTLFWEHHFGRYLSAELLHGQPFWFFVPVLFVASRS